MVGRKRDARRPAFHWLSAAAISAVAVMVAVAVTVTAAVIAPRAIAAAEEQNDDDDEPQAGTVVVSVVKPHDCHLTLLKHSMRREPVWSLANQKIPERWEKTRVFAGIGKRNGGFHG